MNMIKEIYIHKYNIEYYDVDQYKRLKLQNLLYIINNSSFFESGELIFIIEFLAKISLEVSVKWNSLLKRSTYI